MGNNVKAFCRIREIHKAVCDIETRLEHEFGVNLNECILLCLLSSEGSLSSGDIAEKMGLTHSNASKVIKSAENKGLVERSLGSCDKRQMYFSVTASGADKLGTVDAGIWEWPECIGRLL